MTKKYLLYKMKLLKLYLYQLRNLKIIQVMLGLIVAALIIGYPVWVKIPVICILLVILRKSLLTLCVLCTVMSIFFGNQIHREQIQSSLLLGEQSKLELTILSDAQSSNYSDKYVALISNSGVRVLLDFNIHSGLIAGQKIIADSLYLEYPENFSDDFNYIEYLKSQDIWLTGKVRSYQIEEQKNYFLYYSALLRARIKNIILGNINYSNTGLIAGLVIGTRESLDERFKINLQNTGTTHIVAVSGYNVTLLINLLLGFAGQLNRRTILKFSSIALILFGFLIGWTNLPATRAVIMGLITIFTLLVGRRNVGLLAILYASCILLLINPLVINNVSFQLSVAAFFAIIFVAPKVNRFLSRLLKFNMENFASTISVLLVTLPLTITKFGVTSLISPVANLVILPLVPIVTMLSIVAVVLESFSNMISQPIFILVNTSSSLLVWVVNMLGFIDFAATDDQLLSWTFNLVILVIFILADYYEFLEKFNKK